MKNKFSVVEKSTGKTVPGIFILTMSGELKQEHSVAYPGYPNLPSTLIEDVDMNEFSVQWEKK